MEKTNAEWMDLAKRYLKEMNVFTFTNMQTAIIAECLKQYESESKNEIKTSEPHLPLGDVSGRSELACDICEGNEDKKVRVLCKEHYRELHG